MRTVVPQRKSAVAYVRQSHSRSEQEESVSLAFQEEKIRQHATRHEIDIVGVYSDIDVSGNIESRKGLDAMLERCDKGGLDAVVIYNISRLARDVSLYLQLRKRLEKKRITILSTSESIEDKTIATVLSAFAERERTTLSNNVAYAIREQAQRGLVTQMPPYGYHRIDGVLYPQEPEASIVQRIFREYADGQSSMQILANLQADGIRSSRGKSSWRTKAIRAILSRRTYLGEIEISETRDPSGRLRPHLITVGKHEPLIDRATWEIVQRKVKEVGWSRTKPDANPWLTERAFCSSCGHRIYFGRKLVSSTQKSQVWYGRCASASNASETKRTSPCSGQANSLYHLIEPVAREALYHRLCRLTTADAAFRAAQAGTARQGGDRRAELTTRLAAEQAKAEALLELRLGNHITVDVFVNRNQNLLATIDKLQKEIDTIPTETPLSLYVNARTQIEDTADYIATMDDDQLRMLILAIDARAVIDLGAKHVTWNLGGIYADLLPD